MVAVVVKVSNDHAGDYGVRRLAFDRPRSRYRAQREDFLQVEPRADIGALGVWSSGR